MVSRNFSVRLIRFFSLVLLLAGCTKLDTTTIGSEFIPNVDNVYVKADTIEIVTSQHILQDSTKLGLLENHVIGSITNDNDFGDTKATLYLQLKPTFFPYYIGKAPKDSIVKADSVVLCLSYKNFWGDSTLPIQLQVFDIPQDVGPKWDVVDSLHSVNYFPSHGGDLLGSKTIDIRTLGQYVKIGKTDSVQNQIRIKLSDEFVNKLFQQDSTNISPKNAFLSDSLYRIFNKGFEVFANSGNALVYVNLNDDNTRLELHYKKRSRNSNDSGYASTVDTTYSAFYFNAGSQYSSLRRSVAANYIQREHRNIDTSNSSIVCIQTTPGTYAKLKIPALDTLRNIVVHRAEIQIQGIESSNAENFSAPAFLYVDLVDSGVNKWKPVYYDLNPNSAYDPDFKLSGYPFFPLNGQVDIGYFGGNLRNQTGRPYYAINITRYVQQLVTKRMRNYEMRLFAPNNFSYPQYSSAIIPYYNAIARGRVKIGGGAHPDPAYRMKLRIIYSEIK